MSKRTLMVLMVVVLFAVSALGLAVAPGTDTAPAQADESTFAALQFEVQPPSYPYCPGPGDDGCGGDD